MIAFSQGLLYPLSFGNLSRQLLIGTVQLPVGLYEFGCTFLHPQFQFVVGLS